MRDNAQKPRLTLVTPVWNKAGYVGRMIKSVRAQTFTDWELIIIDDGSSDGSLQEVERAAGGDNRIRWYSQANAGVCAARNNGYSYATPGTEYVQFPDSDDMLEPTILAELVATLDANPQAVLAYCKYLAIGPDDEELPTCHPSRKVRKGPFVRRQPDSEPFTNLESILAWAPVSEAISLMRRSAFDLSPRWDIRLGQHGEGVVLFADFALRGDIIYVNRPLYRYRQYIGQNTSDPEVMARQETRVVLRLLSWRGSQSNITSIQRAIVFAEGMVRGIRGIEKGREFLCNGKVVSGTKLIISGLSLWGLAVLVPSMLLFQVRGKCQNHLRAIGDDWSADP
ncbi:MAG: glycosyltransferase family 2 protein [Armatimonadota bacterium]